jgi:hypothetical protein
VFPRVGIRASQILVLWKRKKRKEKVQKWSRGSSQEGMKTGMFKWSQMLTSISRLNHKGIWSHNYVLNTGNEKQNQIHLFFSRKTLAHKEFDCYEA